MSNVYSGKQARENNKFQLLQRETVGSGWDIVADTNMYGPSYTAYSPTGEEFQFTVYRERRLPMDDYRLGWKDIQDKIKDTKHRLLEAAVKAKMEQDQYGPQIAAWRSAWVAVSEDGDIYSLTLTSEEEWDDVIFPADKILDNAPADNLRRRIEDWLRKYARNLDLVQIAQTYGIDTV
jgi:hypothetical protein